MNSWQRAGASRLILLAPLAVFLLALFIYPLFLLLTGGIVGVGKSKTGLELYSLLVFDPFYRSAIINTISVGCWTTLLTLMGGYPVAYWLSRHKGRWSTNLRVLIVFPLIVPGVIRTFGWQAILDRGGFVDATIKSIPGLHWLVLPGSQTAVVIAMASLLLPYMILTLLAVLDSIDPELELAAQDLGYSAFSAFVKVTLPLSANGVAAGCLVVFIMTISNFATPDLISGGRINLISTAIFRAVVAVNMQNAVLFSSVLMFVSLVLTLIYSRLIAKTETR